MNNIITFKLYVPVWICSFLGASLIKLLFVSMVQKCIILAHKHINLKLICMENYDTKQQQKKRSSGHAQNACNEINIP